MDHSSGDISGALWFLFALMVVFLIAGTVLGGWLSDNRRISYYTKTICAQDKALTLQEYEQCIADYEKLFVQQQTTGEDDV